MGILDEAIREHLDLKRRRGADPGEVTRQEGEAFGPARRPEAGAGEHGHGEHDPYAGDEHPTHLHLAETHDPAGPEPVAHDEDPSLRTGPADAHGHAVHEDAEPFGHVPEPAAHERPPEPEPAPYEEAPEPAAHERPPEPEPAPYAHAPEPAAGDEPEPARAATDPLSQPTEAFDPDEVRAATGHVAPQSEAPEQPVEDGDDGEDVLDETPEFLAETPEHDRLWFEQRPPRDFDF